MSRDELIVLVDRIMKCDGTEEIDEMIILLEKNVPDPAVSNLIFFGEPKTPQEIVDRALSYKPILL